MARSARIRTALSRTVARTDLLRRIEIVEPRVILAIAPAGFGKSTLVRQYAQTLDGQVATCDCLAAENALDFARAVCRTLANVDSVAATAYAQQQASGSTETSEWIEFAAALWMRASVSLFIFENAEQIGSIDPDATVLRRLFAVWPRENRLAFCSRRALTVSISRYVAPHEVLSLTVEDLRFTPSEIEQAFADIPDAQAHVHELAGVSRGWPMAVFLLVRLAREGSIAGALKGAGGVQFEQLYDYLSEQVVQGLTEQERALVLCACAIPQPTADEIAAVLGIGEHDVVATVRSMPFVYTMQYWYEVHPLVKTMVRDRFGEECRKLLSRAAGLLREARPLRSAQLYVFGGDQDTAACIIEQAHELLVTELPLEFAEIVGQLDRDVLMRYPGLWAAATAVRATAIPHEQWLDEALIARANLSDKTPPSAKFGVLTSLGNVLSNLGRHEEALAIFEQFKTDPQFGPLHQTVGYYFDACISARCGRFGTALEIWHRVAPAFSGIAFTRAIGIEEVEVRAARYTGRRDAERVHLETALALARESKTPLAIALLLEECAFGAWFAGEMPLFERYVDALERAVVPSTSKATEVFRACARGDLGPLRRLEGYEHPKIRFYAALVACGAAEKDQRAYLAGIALDAAVNAAEPMNEAIACVLCAETGARDVDQMRSRAQKSAAVVDSKVLQREITQYFESRDAQTLLRPLLLNLRSDTERTSRTQQRVSVSILNCTVRIDGSVVPLSAKELEFTLYLAAHTRAEWCTKQRIAQAVWPDNAGPIGTLLRVYTTRVRQRVSPSFIETSRGKLRLSRDVSVDLHDLESLLRTARREDVLSASTRARLNEYVAQFMAASGGGTLSCGEWFQDPYRRAQNAFYDVLLLLGNDALHRRDTATAVTFAQNLLHRDPSDEPANELLIRALLLGDDHPGALRAFRAYRERLRDDLGVEPSSELIALMAPVR